MKKKSQAGNLAGYFAIFLGIVVVAYVFFILSDSLSNSLTDDFTVIDTSLNGTNSLGYENILTGYTIKNTTASSYNETVPIASYTFSASAGTIIFTETKSNQTKQIKVVGEYQTSEMASNATDNIVTGMYNATEQLPQAGTLIGVGVIIGVIALAIWGAKRYGLF